MNLLEMLFGVNQQPASQPTNNVPRVVPIPASPPARPPMQTGGPSLPQGSFNPSRIPNNQVPVPQPRPMPQGGVPVTPPMPAQAPQEPAGPLRDLLMGGGGGGDLRRMLRAFATGAGSVGNTGGDPFRAFGQGMGGAAGYYDQREAAAAKAKADAEKTAYQRSQDAADMELRKVADARAAKTAELTNQKSAIEIRRLAAQDGITPSAYLKLRAQAEEDLGEAVIPDPVKRQQMIDQRYEELLRGYKDVSGIKDDPLSKKPGISPDKAVTATGPNGEKIILKNGEWVPYNQ